MGEAENLFLSGGAIVLVLLVGAAFGPRTFQAALRLVAGVLVLAAVYTALRYGWSLLQLPPDNGPGGLD